jgi:large subunit ribosomal protein L15
MGTTLSTLKPPKGARTSRKRVGRGVGSGLGKTSGSGGKGQTARSGCTLGRGFEGGQMPLQRRMPKRGFHNIFRVEVEQVNLDTLDQSFESGIVDPEAMRARGVVPRKAKIIKVLGRGELSKPLTVKAHRFSEAAKTKILAAGGVAEIIEGQPAKAHTAEAG